MLFFKKNPTFDSFRWDSSGWTSERHGPEDRRWVNNSGDMAIQKFKLEVPTGLPADWRCVESLRRAMAVNRPATLGSISIDVIPLRGDVICAQYINKEFMPKPSLGILYHGMVTMPFRDFFCNFFFVTPEHGTTGIREAVLVAKGMVPMPEMKEAPVIKNKEELEEMYRKAREGAPRATACDSEEFDAMFPQHPLSRLRGYLKAFRESLVIDDGVKRHKQFGG